MADLDGDGKRELISGGFEGEVYRWRLPVEASAREVVLSLKRHAAFKKLPHVAAHAVDWDGDGGVDLLIGARNGTVFLCANTGKGSFAKPKSLGVSSDGGDAGPHAADWDGDGDLDLLVGGDFGSVRLFVNTGTRRRPVLAKPVVLVPRRGGRIAEPRCKTNEYCARRAKPWVVDWNGDGKPDLLVGDMHDHRTPQDQANDKLTGWVWLYLRR